MRRCRSLGDCTLSCGCKGHWFLSPNPSRATGETPIGDIAGGNSDGRGRAQRGRGGSTANHGRGRSTAHRRRSEARGASNASRAAVQMHRDGELCWRDGGE